MKKPTKAQRHAIYKKAMRLLGDEADGGGRGLCFCIDCASDDRFVSPYHEKSDWPEFASQEPRVPCAENDCYWWSRTPQGYAARRRALQRCIDMTAPPKED